MSFLKKENKTEQLIIRLTPSQKEEIKYMAAERKLSVSELLLSLLDAEQEQSILKNKNK